MLITGIALGLVLGLLLGGRLENLANIRLRFLPLLFVAVIFRFAVEAALGFGLPVAEALRMPLLALAYGLLLFVLWKNRWYPGLVLAMVGIGLNGLAILANGGRMPVWLPAYEMSGIPGPIDSVLHFELAADVAPTSCSASAHLPTSSRSRSGRSRTLRRSVTCSSPRVWPSSCSRRSSGRLKTSSASSKTHARGATRDWPARCACPARHRRSMTTGSPSGQAPA